MPKLVFIEPQAPNLHIFSQFTLPRLGSLILSTMAKQQGWQVTVYFEQDIAIDWEEVRTADLVAVSTITSTAPRAYAICDRVAGMGIPAIIGGPHVTFMAEEALQHAPFVMLGEAEISFAAFLKAFPDRSFQRVPSLCYMEQGNMVRTERCAAVCDLDQLPFPDFSVLASPLQRLGGKKIIPMQTSRGCPYDCAFCSVTGMFGRKYRFRSRENILAELERYNSPDNYIFFYDDNFAAHPRRTRDLLEGMIERGITCKWSTQVRADICKDVEMVQLMKRAGCHTVFVGFESVNPSSLEAMKKKQTIEDIHRAAVLLRRNGIQVHGMFVYGFDDDDWRTVKAAVRFAKRTRLTSTQFMILTPFPGTRSYEQLEQEGRIKFRDWSLYDAHHVVFKPRHFTFYALQQAQLYSHRQFYSVRESIKKLLQRRWIAVGLAHYARRLQAGWKKYNKKYLQVIRLLTPSSKEKVTIDYRKEIVLE
jgi:radical SAM superfamily enzyme YgiQ (UPF0313 family)